MSSEKKIFSFDATVLNEVQSCGRKFQLGHVMNLRPLEKAMPLDRGSMLHDMLATYRILTKLSWANGDKNKLTTGEFAHLGIYGIAIENYPWKAIVDAAVHTGRQYMAGADLSAEDGEVTIDNMIEYFDFYQNDGWQPIEVESSFSKVLFDSPELMLIYEGRVDLLTDSRAGRTVVDSKSSGRSVAPILLSNQFIGYSWALEVPSITVDKIGFQKTLKARERFVRVPLSYPQQLQEEWVEWAIWWGKIAVFYVENGVYPPNFTSCDKYGGCIFLKACSTTPGAREWKLSTMFVPGKQWSPQNTTSNETE